MLRATKIVETCGACPAQWSGRLEDGRELYIRFRWGHLRAEVAGEVIFEWSKGDRISGVMGFQELERHLKDCIDFSEVEWVDGVEDL